MDALMRKAVCWTVAWQLVLPLPLSPLFVPILPGMRLGPAWAEEPRAPLGAELSPEARRRVADRLERLLDAVEEAAREMPRDRFDVHGVLDAAGRDPEKLLGWVKANTEWVPYEGALRGAAGVLMDRLGNSLDRAILLLELARAAGQKARLARGELSDEEARRIIERAAVPRPVPPAREAEALGPAMARALADFPELGDWRRTAAHESARAAEEAVQAAAAAAAEVDALVGGPRGPGAAEAEADQDGRPKRGAALLAAARDHWWVQVRRGGEWIHLDPLAPAAGGALAGEGQPLEAEAPPGRLPVEEALCHEHEIREVIEKWAAGRLEELTALRRSVRP
ncbi:MAG: hypothetical protein HY721_18610, partial [Planctomycetes bacterium]|nr:hypothetical protein [Planctomycetota bacterium]